MIVGQREESIAGLNPCKERNALTEVARTEQRKPISNVGLMTKNGRLSRVQINLDAIDKVAG